MVIFKRIRGGPWNTRLYDVAGSQGWSLGELSEHLGFKYKVGTPTLIRVLKGGRPSVKFLLALEKLESAYAGEIAAFIRSHRKWGRFIHKRFLKLKRDIKSGKVPADTSKVGVLAAVRALERDRRRQRESYAQRMARHNVKKWYKRPARKKAWVGQSYAQWQKQERVSKEFQEKMNANKKEKAKSVDG